NSKEVANLTKEVGKTISTLTYLDKNDKINVKKYRETHPIALIKRNGDIVLVKKNLFQKAVIKSQKTFAKGVGRKRIDY
ncbi:MAG: hypothetical protein M1594_01380, partial [Candidatus Marsarchaeota archaeon]|nr:hypothetical protein [Candidatus Marsarchaeota archaeon]